MSKDIPGVSHGVVVTRGYLTATSLLTPRPEPVYANGSASGRDGESGPTWHLHGSASINPHPPIRLVTAGEAEADDLLIDGLLGPQ